MNKNQLIDSVSEAVDLPKSKVGEVLDSILDTITQSLIEKEQVAIAGFGTFSSKERAARVGRDPRTGNPLNIPASTVAGFKPAKALKDALNTEKA